MVVFSEFISILFNIIILIFILKRILNGKIHNIYIIYGVFFIFFILPMVLDYIIGIPNYTKYPGFYLSSIDDKARIYYSIYCILVPMVFLKFGKNKNVVGTSPLLINSHLNKYKYILYAVSFSSLIIIIFSPDLLIYLEYAAAPKKLLSPEGSDYHQLLSLTTRLSIIAIMTILLGSGKDLKFKLLLFSPLIFLNIWIHGKRSIIALTLVLLIFVIWKKKVFSPITTLTIAVFAGLFLYAFSNIYQGEVRNMDDKSFQEKYENFRVDYGRDDVTRFTIYKEYVENDSILEYRAQTLFYYSLLFVPRSIWDEKPLPYAQYMTSAIFYTSPKMWGWGMTTSILEEAISNFSLFGFFIGPYILSIIVRTGEKSNNDLFSLLSLLLGTLLLIMHLTPIYFFLMLWLLILIVQKTKNINLRKVLYGYGG